jgi:hypothetical protein
MKKIRRTAKRFKNPVCFMIWAKYCRWKVWMADGIWIPLCNSPVLLLFLTRTYIYFFGVCCETTHFPECSCFCA